MLKFDLGSKNKGKYLLKKLKREKYSIFNWLYVCKLPIWERKPAYLIIEN